MKGFSLLEFVLVIAIMIMIASLSFPFFRPFFASQQLDATADELIANLRRAQQKAMAQEQNSAWGLSWQTGQYTIFSEDSSDFDEVINYNQALTITASGQILFSQLTGLPDSAASISVSNPKIDETKTITINSQGLISD